MSGENPPPGECNQENNSNCCKEGETYPTYDYSPPVSGSTNAKLTLNGFGKNQDGGHESKCDEEYHTKDELVVALSTGWFDKKARCLTYININGNENSVKAKVVDECDSTMGCDEQHAYQPPCDCNIVDASEAVWKALGVPEDNWGGLDITWSDA
ncbi:putative ripening-related protein 1 isoform X2 [Pistacia vera]|nr:putative ripening-related protein 1 isoform X2 [Pistacia vera]